ncbi:MAG: hypothetical protein QOH08_2556 [Chloroflexota bacterium]|nr:hypothetical protein [Chloroflexota bacterium]
MQRNLSESFYTALVRDCGDAVVTFDLDGTITSWNPGAVRLYGHPEAVAIGKPTTLFVPQDQVFRLHANRKRLLAGEPLPSYANTHCRCDGTRFDVSVTLSPIHDGSGTVIGASAVIRDVTQSRLERERIQRTLDSLATLDQRREEFLALLAHEIRLPAAAIGLLAEGLARAPQIGERERAAALRLREQAASLSRLAEDALAIAHLEGDTARIDLRQDDLVRALDVAVSRVGDARVDARLPDRPLWLRIDRERLAQAVVNLLANALKYSDAPAPVQLRVRELDGSVRIEVRDEGIGITPEQADRLFQKYARAQRAGQRDPGGAGLGLYLARLVAEAHGGRVHVESAGIGLGSTFAITIPRSSSAE